MEKERRKKRSVSALITAVLLIVAMGFSQGDIVIAASLMEHKGTVSDNKLPAEIEREMSKEETGTVSGNTAVSDMTEKAADDMLDITVLPGRQQTTTVVLPSRLEVAFNPMRLAVTMGDGSCSTEQILSGVHEIVNKGPVDQLVTVRIGVEDLNGGQVVFLDSPEAVESVGEDSYAIYLSVLSTKKASDIGDSERTEVPDHDGKFLVSFEIPAGGMETFVFGGEMNEKEDWSKLSGGIRLSVNYTYEEVKGNETEVISK